MQEGGKKLRAVMKKLLPHVKHGTTTLEIDRWADQLIKEEGAQAGFKKVKNYRFATCLPINEQVVHTPPTDRKILQGDVLTIDIGVLYKNYNTDYATTFVVGGKSNEETKKFLKIGERALDKAIETAKNAKYIGEISQTIQKEIYGHGYFILRELTGHGIGRDLHEEPYIPGVLDRKIEQTYKIKPGLAIAIEVIYSTGTQDIEYEAGSDWSIVTKDRSLSACFERTIAFFGKNALILT